jgi:hypothetical protein
MRLIVASGALITGAVEPLVGFLCHHQPMEMEKLEALNEKDQQIFLLGRIAFETSSLDIALRFVHGALRGHKDLDAFLDAPDNFSNNVRACTDLAKSHRDLSDELRTAVLAAIAEAAEIYRTRNRYTHDLLRADLMNQGWELARLTRQNHDTPESIPVSFNDMVDLVLKLVTATWRLRGCGLYVLSGQWENIALGSVEGRWDGTAESSR